MPTKILYEQIKAEGKEIVVPGPDLFIMTMNRAFGKFPLELDKSHLERLEGMTATWTDVSTNPYDVLVRAIKRLGDIRVYAEYPTGNDNDEKTK